MNFAMVILGLKEMEKKSDIMKSGLDAMPLFLQNDLLSNDITALKAV